MYPAQGVDQFDTVTDGDIGDVSALAREDGRDPGRRDPRVDGGAGRFSVGESLQPGEPLRVSGVRHRTGETGVCAGKHPRHTRTDHVPADQHEQARGQIVGVVGRVLSALLQPRQCEPSPGLAGMLLDAAQFPTLLPGVARKRRQPAQQLGHTASSTRLGPLDTRRKQS